MCYGRGQFQVVVIDDLSSEDSVQVLLVFAEWLPSGFYPYVVKVESGPAGAILNSFAIMNDIGGMYAVQPLVAFVGRG